MLPAMRFAFLVLILSACGRSGAEDSGEREGACGEPSEVDLTLKVAVHDSDGIGLQDINVDLEDRGWTNSALGGGVTDEDGEVEFVASGVTDLPNCWGTLLDYVVVATDSQGQWRTGEKSANSYLYTAIDDASMEADMRAFPVVMEPVEEER
ncbi:MAG: hypothetical protein VX519_06925 [Myxococcota bacterium]|nr:hypothetical protein [Myxococcota bacterium]